MKINPNIKCDKVDILAYSYGKFEVLVSKIYLNWIKTAPSLYNSIYQYSVYKNKEINKRYRLYELLFTYFMKRIIEEKQPDLIVCTHALPAYMLNYLKEKKDLRIPVINVYTDYFIHRFWGVENIDFHFVSSHQMKNFLIKKGISDERIFITGISIHYKIKRQTHTTESADKSVRSVLVSGGNLGVGAIEDLIEKVANTKDHLPIQFYVLCGKNDKLYKKVKDMQKSHIIPYSYIDCMDKMNGYMIKWMPLSQSQAEIL